MKVQATKTMKKERQDKTNKKSAGTFPAATQRLRELSDTITAAIIARRHAENDEQREKLNEILTRAYDEKYLLLGL